MSGQVEKRPMDASPEGVPIKNLIAPPVRRCESCLSQHPLEQFRRRRQGGEARMRRCRQCHNLRERVRRAGIRYGASHRDMAKAMTQLKNNTAAARVPVFCAEMVQHFGGADQFLNAWKGCIDRDLEKGGLSAFRHIAVLIQFMEHCEPEPVDYSTMSDDELIERAIAAGLQHPGAL
jgi:hypothetical protein